MQLLTGTTLRARSRLVDVGLTVVVISLVTGVAIARYVSFVNADSLLSALISTQRLTVYYWGQDRLASVVPLLASPIRDDLWNFRFQMLLLGAAFFSLFLMFVRFHLRLTARHAVAGLAALGTGLAGFAVMTALTGSGNYVFIFEQIYALSLTLYLLGARMLVTTSSRARGMARCVGAVLILVAILLNPSAVLYVPVLWIVDDGGTGRRKRISIGVGVSVTAFAVGWLSSRVYFDGPRQPAYFHFSLARAEHGFGKAVNNILAGVHPSVVCLLGVACIAILGLRWRSLPTRLRIAYIGAPIYGLLWLALFSGNEWVEMNLYYGRYFFPVYAAGFFIVAGAMAELVGLVHDRVDRPRMMLMLPTGVRLAASCAAAVAAVFVAVAWCANTEIPALRAAADGVDAARRNDVRFVVGDYWTTWPLVVAGRHAGLDLLGVTVRSVAIHDEITSAVNDSLEQTGSVRILCSSVEAEQCATQFAEFTQRGWFSQRISTPQEPLVLDLRPA